MKATRRICRPFGAWAGSALLAAWTCAATPASAQSPPQPPGTPRAALVKQFEITLAGPHVSDYWLGLIVAPMPDVLRAQLKIEQGVVVANVQENSPAAKAGVQAHDILLKVAGQDIVDPNELIKAVDEVKEKEVELVLLRAGEQVTVKATPEKRPPEARTPHPPQGAHAMLQQWAQNMGAGNQPGDIVVWRVAPGVAMPPGAPFGFTPAAGLSSLPPNTTVTITKSGDGPPQIQVQQNDQTWSVTPETLHELPPELRQPIGQLLAGPQRIMLAPHGGRGIPGMPGFPGGPGVPPGGPHIAIAPGHVPAQIGQGIVVGGGANEELMKKVDELLSKVEALQKDVEQLQKQD